MKTAHGKRTTQNTSSPEKKQLARPLAGDNENNYDYFGARYYDSRVANWTSIDPLFEKHLQWTPYNYVLRNPMRFIDPTGKQVETALGLAATVAAAVAVTYAIYQASTIIINGIKEGHLGSYTNPILFPVVIGVTAYSDIDYVKRAINLAYPWQNAKESNLDKSETENEKPDSETKQVKPEYPVPELDEEGKPKGDEWIPPKTPEGNWTKPKPSKEYLRPDPKHKPPIGPHTDWRDPSGNKWRIFPDNKVLPKKN